MVTSPANPRVKRLARLRERKARDGEGVFLVEGMPDIGMAVSAGLEPREVYYDPAVFPDPPVRAELVLTVAPEALARASYRGVSPGILAVFPQFPTDLARISPSRDRPLLALALEGIEKPGNLGAVLRTADAAGADLVVAVDPGTDPFNPNVLRASTGALFTVPLAVAGLEETGRWARSHGVAVIAADPLGDADYWSVDLGADCLLLVGSEHHGLTPEARERADLLVRVPMWGRVDSLNASVTAALLAYEVRRQRISRR